MNRGKRQSIIFAIIAVTIIGIVAGYSYSAEQTRLRGFNFGNELAQIQEEVRQIQMDFNSKLVQWNEGDLEDAKLLEYADLHLMKLGSVINEYDTLNPPPQFSASVELFKLSTDSQQRSDRHYIEWIKTGQDQYRIRSDALLQESFDYEMLALGEFGKAKMGQTEYGGESAKFAPPDTHITKKVNKIWENMKESCHANATVQGETDRCIADADRWRTEHLP